MNIDNKLFFKIWEEIILGDGIELKNEPQTINELKHLLSNSLDKRIEELLTQLDIRIPLTLNNEEYLKKIIEIFSNYNVHDAGFYPSAILKYKGLTCAGASVLVSHLLSKKGIIHFYARPVGHSVNIIRDGNTYHWFDAHNGVYNQIDGEVIEIDDFKIMRIKSQNPRIHYKIAILFNPSDSYYPIFVNLQHLIDIKSQYIEESDLKELMNINFNDLIDYIFPNVKKYIRKDDEYLEEVKRIRGLE